MGYIPNPPPLPPLTPDGRKPPISVADEATFDAWIALPVEDTRTIEEYAQNPVLLVRRLPGPPPPPPSSPPDSGSTWREVRNGIQPDKPWPRA